MNGVDIIIDEIPFTFIEEKGIVINPKRHDLNDDQCVSALKTACEFYPRFEIACHLTRALKADLDAFSLTVYANTDPDIARLAELLAEVSHGSL